MIKAKIQKNIIRKSNNSLGLNTKQFIAIGIAIALGFMLYLILRNRLPFSVYSTIIFTVMLVIICCGVINIQGQSLIRFFIQTLKGPDIRYYRQEGVYTNVLKTNTKNGKR